MGLENGGSGRDDRYSRCIDTVSSRFALSGMKPNGDGVASCGGDAVGNGVSVDKVASDVSVGLNAAAAVGGGKRRIIVSGRVNSVNGTVSAGNVVGASMFLSGSGKKQPVSVWSDAGGVILAEAMDRGSEVAIVRASGEVLRGIPFRYESNSSGFALSIVGEINYFQKGDPRRAGGRRVGIFSSDFVILSSDYPLDVADVANETESAVEQVCEQDLRVLSADTAYRRDFDVGHFLHEVDKLSPRGASVRVEEILSPKIKDVFRILQALEPGLTRFLRVFLCIGNLNNMSLRSAVDALAIEKSFPSDTDKTPDQQWEAHFDMAMAAANVALSRWVPSIETKESGTTVTDHGAVVQVKEIDGSEKRGRAFLPDLKEGDLSCRDALFEWHSMVRDTVLPQLDARNHKLLVDALLFQYCGVPVGHLQLLYSKGVMMNSIAVANRTFADFGLRVILNNGFAVLAKVGEPVTLLADCEDAKKYTGRFSWEVSGSVEDAIRLYRAKVDEKISRKRSIIAECTRVKTVNDAIREFVKTSNDVRNSDARIGELVDAFVSDRKEDDAEQPDWIEVVEELTPELRALHELAHNVGFGGVRGPIRGNRDCCYFHGQLLLLALVGKYHGVSRADIERLPFSFKRNGDSDLDAVIENVNSRIGVNGIRVHERGGVLVLGSTKVQILKKKLPTRGRPRHHILQLLRKVKSGGDEAEAGLVTAEQT